MKITFEETSGYTNGDIIKTYRGINGIIGYDVLVLDGCVILVTLDKVVK